MFLCLRENYHYLSGMLIGTELKDLSGTNCSKVTIVSDEKLLPLYSMALEHLGLKKGQSSIYKANVLIKSAHGKEF